MPVSPLELLALDSLLSDEERDFRDVVRRAVDEHVRPHVAQWFEEGRAPTRELALDRLLADDSTFYGDLFPHVVNWDGQLYLEDGVHRALRAALQQRNQIHARVLVIDN